MAQFYDSIQELTRLSVSEIFSTCKKAVEKNMRALDAYFDAYFYQRGSRIEFSSPYFKCREEDTSSYIGDEKCKAKQYFALWSWQIGPAQRSDYQNMQSIFNGHASNVISFSSEVKIKFDKEGKEILDYTGHDIHVFLGPQHENEKNKRISYSTIIPQPLLNTISFALAIEYIELSLKHAKLMEDAEKYLKNK